ncbi:branched-chain amino acid ABC transporter permease [Roseomonas sp. KE2513]|uniref:branched-chain amino acid ABC transporter permease n=1 Tax=Roseomonas sp. KE2513 TaxID=2479202 RepID=UPI0018DF9B24|nr:branched-chain amino acid ABC transporter permease [Roseomonas sp. KE2513]MBI0538168.1 branched-chain amino acid ABC transporter permease [Roseomonas sp. KE2513]
MRLIRIGAGLPLLLAAVASFFLFPEYLSLLNTLFILAIFALAYDLLQGHAGVVSLGHAVFFGMGAYTAAVLAAHGVTEPVVGLLAALLLSGLLALLLTRIVVVGNDLTRLLVTLGIGFLMLEAANQARWLTGGADGMSDFTMGPVLGLFRFDFAGETAFWYSLAALVLVYAFLWRLTTSPFGLALRGIRENVRRMPAIGAPVRRHLATAYTISGGIAGLAGALLAQTSNFASLDMLGFERSAEVMMMATLGGTGSIPGVVLGAVGFSYLKDALSAMSPKYWHLGIGLVLMLSVFVLRGGIAGGVSALLRRLRGRG